MADLGIDHGSQSLPPYMLFLPAVRSVVGYRTYCATLCVSPKINEEAIGCDGGDACYRYPNGRFMCDKSTHIVHLNAAYQFESKLKEISLESYGNEWRTEIDQ